MIAWPPKAAANDILALDGYSLRLNMSEIETQIRRCESLFEARRGL